MDPIEPNLADTLHPYCPDFTQKSPPVRTGHSMTPTNHRPSVRPFVTLTYAQSLDSRISAKPGVQTKILGPKTKVMTHYIRSKHDAIMVGAGTVRADDPKLNCRYQSGKSPRPVILDPNALWDYETSQLRQIHDLGAGLAPFIIVDTFTTIAGGCTKILEDDGGKILRIAIKDRSVEKVWEDILVALYHEGIMSIMIEGGARVISDLLMMPQVIDSVIITIGPVFLGKDGVEVAPREGLALEDVSWWHGGGDSVVCGRPESRKGRAVDKSL